MTGIRITVIGTGYVGLVSGACFAELGHDVICVDKDRSKIAALHTGAVPIYEPGLAELIARNATAGRLRFSTDVGASVRGRNAVVIAVGTPTKAENGHADLRHVFAAAEEVAADLEGYTVVVTKSTVPVGTNRLVSEIIARGIRPDATFGIASNPEFLREGAAVEDFMSPDRIVVGTDDERALGVMQTIYQPIWSKGARFYATGLETAELVKYASNAFLAVKISFINEIADLCEKVRADVHDVAEGMGLDTRIGSSFLRAGPGWGGSCFPKDTRALYETARESQVDISIVEAAIRSNERRKRAMVGRIETACGGDLRGKQIAVLGVTFKGQTDDMRDSPSLQIVPAMQAKGAEIRAHDPADPKDGRRLLPGVTWCADPYEAAWRADAAVILTEWKVFEKLDLARLATVLASPILVDLRNLFDPAEAAKAGLSYFSVGRAPARPKAPQMPSVIILPAKARQRRRPDRHARPSQGEMAERP